MVHLSTTNPDGSPQVTVIWIGLDGDDLVSTHMRDNVKLRNIRRDPRVAALLRRTTRTRSLDQPLCNRVCTGGGRTQPSHLGPDDQAREGLRLA